MGKIYVVLGKSATGKDTIYQAVYQKLKQKVKTIVTYTTRPIRDSEVEGREYHFVEEARFQELKEDGKVIEARAYNTVYGIWRYFTVNDGQIDLQKNDYFMIGTLESYLQIREYFGDDKVVPIYVQVDTGVRLTRALDREKKQTAPKYVEMCRRFIADEQDFSEEKIQAAGIVKRYENNCLEDCVQAIVCDICKEIEDTEK